MSTPDRLRIILFREGRFWLAQGLEHDVGTQAQDLHELVDQFVLQLKLEGQGLATLPPAPPYFQALWPLAAGTFDPVDPPASTLRLDWRLVA